MPEFETVAEITHAVVAELETVVRIIVVVLPEPETLMRNGEPLRLGPRIVRPQ